MRCESCHQREATVEYRRNTEGAHQVYQLCERCAANLPDGDEVARAPGELLGALSEDADEVLQAAAQRAVARGAAVILPEDLLAGILDTPCAAQDLLREAGIGLDDVERRLPRPVEGELLQRRRAKLAPALKLALELARQEAKAARLATVSPGLLLLGLLLEGDSAAAKLLRDHGIKPDLLRERVRQAPPFGLPPRRQGVTRLPRHLAKYTSDLTAAAAAGRLDAVIGREAEIGRLIRILARRSKNNPVLIGESGVGKTAIVEGLAQRIATGRVPQGLRDKLLLSLDLAGMVAGARYRGDFEERLKGLLREIQGMGGRVLLFIDELHTVIGAGTAEGSTLDASHMLKPILARRELQCIGATTLEEYRKHIERDAALERRFQPILVAEPTVEATIAILRGLKPSYEAHHGVTVTDEALVAAAELAEKYVQDRLLPDKAIDLLDEACAARQLEERPGTAVGPDDIAEVVSEWTGVPVRKLLQAEGTRLLEMEHHLRRRVIGQEEAVEAVSEAVRRAR
ncbi:MAG: chaperone, partial [Cyanobacteria bacterium RYN_339]|nr:chaperone [Cyanobacteria bacterium RYN_339]